MNLFSLASIFFIVTNPLGNAPAISAMIRRYDLKKQVWIMIREGLAALLLAIFFQYLGEVFLGILSIQKSTVSFCGGILLLICAIDLIFPNEEVELEVESSKKEPFIVPIATPLLSGPGLLTMIMLKSQQEPGYMITIAILVAWIGVMGVLLAAPYLQKVLGKRGMIAMEQFMGLILTMISVDLVVRGMVYFLKGM